MKKKPTLTVFHLYGQEPVLKRNKRPTTSSRQPVKHPGEVLLSEFMKPLGLTANRLAMALHVSPPRIGEIINGRRGITAETALRLSKFFGTTAKSWLDLQSDYELSQAEQKWARTIEQEIQALGFRQNSSAGPAKRNQEKSQSQERLSAEQRLTESQRKIYGLLGENLVPFDVLIQNSGMSIGELSTVLTVLELSGLVKRHPGDRYSQSD